MNNAKPMFGQDTIFARLYYQEADYAALHAEAEALRAENARLRQAMQRLVTTHCAASMKSHATDAELEQYLAVGIAQIEAERDALRAELAEVKGREAVAWYTEDHLDDKSATTHRKEVAERWRSKGWPIWPLYASPPAAATDEGEV